MRLRAFITAVLLIPVAAILAQGPKVDLIHLDPQPAINGGCPAHVHFTGRVRTNGPLDVEYQWLRSDGAHTEHRLHFNRASVQPIATDWTLSGHYSGWMQLVILSPSRMQTAKASFAVNCGR